MGIDAKMYISVPRIISPEEVLEKSRLMINCLGTKSFWMDDEPDSNKIMAKGQTIPHALSIVKEMDQDCDGPMGTITPNKNETLIEPSLLSRFYGKDYERGPFHEHIMICNFLKFHWPDGKVYYGGDSSGIMFEEMTDEWLDNITAHFFTVGHNPYTGGFISLNNSNIIKPTDCKRCLAPMIQYGWGNDYAAFTCNGCEHKVETYDNGKTYINLKTHIEGLRQELFNQMVKQPELYKLFNKCGFQFD